MHLRSEVYHALGERVRRASEAVPLVRSPKKATDEAMAWRLVTYWGLVKEARNDETAAGNCVSVILASPKYSAFPTTRK
jgi:hypothetical protein